jgi:hypothetical protein
MKKFIVLSIVLLMLAGFAITSSAMEVKTLLADQIIDVGTLTVEIDVDGNLVVTYNITDPWVLGDTHLYVGTLPPKKSAPGRFRYGPEDAVDGVYTILEDELPDPDVDGNIVIAAQAEVTNPDEPDIYDNPREETAWAEGDRIRPNKNWAMCFEFPLPTE